MALDDYFSDPSQDCLARLFDAVNAMDITAAPTLTRHEKIVMRCSERNDIFSEKFVAHAKAAGQDPFSSSLAPSSAANPLLLGATPSNKTHRPTGSADSYSSFEEGILMRQRERTNESATRETAKQPPWDLGPASTVTAATATNSGGNGGRDRSGTESTTSQPQHSPRSDSPFSLGGNAVWVGEEASPDGAIPAAGGSGAGVKSATSVGSSTLVTNRGRSSTDASSSSSTHGRELGHAGGSSTMLYSTGGVAKDTHFYHTSIAYKGHQIPIKMPLFTFPEEVGDVNLNYWESFQTDALTLAFWIVLSDTTHPNIFYAVGGSYWSIAPASAYERQPDPSNHASFQRLGHW
jgi:hypothetical protein